MSGRQSALLIPGIILSLVLCAVARPAEAVWIWTPKTGKFVNPKYAVKDTPEEQFKFAQTFYEKKDYKRARLEFKNLLRYYAQSAWAPEAQIGIAKACEAERDYYQAFLEYRKALQTYPSVTRVEEVVEHEFQIGELFLQGQKRKLLGSAEIIPAQEKSVEVFLAILEDAPYSAWGDKAQFKLGEAYRTTGDFDKSRQAFEELLARYPNSPLVDQARFEIAMSAKRGAAPAGYDQQRADDALKEFGKFKEQFPQSGLQPQVEQEIRQLVEQRAQHAYEVGQFYERTHAATAARIYYQDIVTNYADTSWASKAQARLQALGGTATP